MGVEDRDAGREESWMPESNEELRAEVGEGGDHCGRLLMPVALPTLFRALLLV